MSLVALGSLHWLDLGYLSDQRLLAIFQLRCSSRVRFRVGWFIKSVDTQLVVSGGAQRSKCPFLISGTARLSALANKTSLKHYCV